MVLSIQNYINKEFDYSILRTRRICINAVINYHTKQITFRGSYSPRDIKYPVETYYTDDLGELIYEINEAQRRDLDKEPLVTPEMFAHRLNNRQYGFELMPDEIQIAKDNGLVVVTGYSDDNAEFEGAIENEISCFDGGKIYFNNDGFHWNDSLGKYEGSNMVEAVWCSSDPKDKTDKGETISWTYKTEIPHFTFMIYDDFEPYCRGIVFSVDDLK